MDTSDSFSVATDAARETATAIAVAALDKKASGVEILDVAGKVDYADFLVIMTGRGDRHTSALAQGIEEALKKKGTCRSPSRACRTAPGCSWTMATWSCTCSRTRPGRCTTSKGCGSTRGDFPCRSRPLGALRPIPSRSRCRPRSRYDSVSIARAPSARSVSTEIHRASSPLALTQGSALADAVFRPTTRRLV